MWLRHILAAGSATHSTTSERKASTRNPGFLQCFPHQSRYELRRAGLIRVPTRETMTLAYWMLIAAAMLPYLTIALAKSAGGIDNRAPRPSLESLSGWRQRADWSHRNHFEAFPACSRGVRCGTDTRATEPDRPVGRHFRAFARDLYGTVRSGSGHSAIDRLFAWPDRRCLAVRVRRLRVERASQDTRVPARASVPSVPPQAGRTSRRLTSATTGLADWVDFT